MVKMFQKMKDMWANRDNKVLDYVCPYCGCEFQQMITSGSHGSGQVRCPTCGNFLKTSEGK